MERTITVTLVGDEGPTDQWASYLTDELIWHLDNEGPEFGDGMSDAQLPQVAYRIDTSLADLIAQSRRWCDAWTDTWGDDGEPIDGNYDPVYALEDEAREIVEALATLGGRHDDTDPE